MWHLYSNKPLAYKCDLHCEAKYFLYGLLLTGKPINIPLLQSVYLCLSLQNSWLFSGSPDSGCINRRRSLNVTVLSVSKPLLLRTSKIMPRTINLFLSAPPQQLVSLSLYAIPYTRRPLLVLQEWELSSKSIGSQSFQPLAFHLLFL
jgi:hypothetical protein